MTELSAAQERLEKAIGHLERALDQRAAHDRELREEASALRANSDAVAKRLDAAIERLQSILEA